MSIIKILYDNVERQLFSYVDLILENSNVVRLKALWDTGANKSGIFGRIVNKFSLRKIENIVSYTNSGSFSTESYHTFIQMQSDFPIMEIMLTRIENEYDMLIGMDIISCGDFSFSSHNGKTKCFFRYPSQADIILNDL